jgi:hypothetical protein
MAGAAWSATPRRPASALPASSQTGSPAWSRRPRTAPPAFSSTAPTAAVEGQTLRYDIACADPDGDAVTLSIAPDDTCGGRIEANTYVLTPSEALGGASCLLRVLCADAQIQEAQSSTVAVAEVNAPPLLNNLPASASALWGRAGSFAVTAADADLPAQPLTFSVTTACPFPVTIDASSGLVAFTCGAAAESCDATVSVSDGVASSQSTLSISCANAPPAVTDVSISPATAYINTPLSCAYTFSDADGDMDQSTIEWLVNDAVAAAGPAFTPARSGDRVACRVTPNDGAAAGAPVSSPPIVIAKELDVSAGDKHSCVVLRGALKCWGDNTSGQLGDGSNTSRGSLAPVTGMDAGVSAVAAGRAHTCAIQSGALYCWGANDSGQLGDNTNSSSNVPNPVTGMGAGVTAVAAGSAHTCAVQRGLLSCWGDNMSGQLGDGTTTARNTPAQLRSL